MNQWKLTVVIALLLSATGLGAAQTPYRRLVSADREPGNWLTYSGTYNGQRCSPLKQITPSNAAQLKVAWVYQIEGRTRFETTPLVVDGVMYLTEPPTKVTALDLRTGRKLWAWQRMQARSARTLGFGPTNRGVAILDELVYVGTLDGYLVALDATTGALKWEFKLQAPPWAGVLATAGHALFVFGLP